MTLLFVNLNWTKVLPFCFKCISHIFLHSMKKYYYYIWFHVMWCLTVMYTWIKLSDIFERNERNRVLVVFFALLCLFVVIKCNQIANYILGLDLVIYVQNVRRSCFHLSLRFRNEALQFIHLNFTKSMNEI